MSDKELTVKIEKEIPAVGLEPVEPEAYLVSGPYTKAPFRDKSSAEAYCSGLSQGDPKGDYKIIPLYARPPKPEGACS